MKRLPPGDDPDAPGHEPTGADRLTPANVSMHGNAHDGARVFQAINMYVYEPGVRSAENAADILAERVISLAEKADIGDSFRVTPYLHRPMVEAYVARHEMDDGEKILASFGSNPKTGAARRDGGSHPSDPLCGPAYVLVTSVGVRYVVTTNCGLLRYVEDWEVAEYHRRLPMFGSKGAYWPKRHGLQFAFADQGEWVTSGAYWWQRCRDVSVLAQFISSVKALMQPSNGIAPP